MEDKRSVDLSSTSTFLIQFCTRFIFAVFVLPVYRSLQMNVVPLALRTQMKDHRINSAGYVVVLKCTHEFPT